MKPSPSKQTIANRVDSVASALIVQQAKNPARRPQFLQIVAKPERAPAASLRRKPEPKLTRVAFRVSRLMEFCTERELENQTGHSVWDWPLVVAKELVDNALDAAEEAEVAPDITVIVEKDTIIVQDNADGIAAETIESVLDYTIRVSSPRGLCLADPRRAGQRAQDHPRDGLRARRSTATAPTRRA